jgi:type IV pilus assembly protein PilA
MIQRLRNRIARSEAEGGFTLIELLVVIIIIGILLAVAVPSYLGFRDRANNNAVKANVRAAVPAVEAYYSDNGTYTGMSIASLKAIDSGLKLESVTVINTPTAGAGYCIQSDTNADASGGTNDHKLTGPGGEVVSGTC